MSQFHEDYFKPLMMEVQIFADENQEQVLREVCNEHFQATGFCIRTVHTYPHGQYKLFNVIVLDQQAAFNLGMLYQKALTKYKD